MRNSILFCSCVDHSVSLVRKDYCLCEFRMAFNLGFIGGGNMSTAIVKGIIQNEAHPPPNIWVSGPRLQSLEHWKAMGTHITIDNAELLKECDIIILGVKPAMLEEAISTCKNHSIPPNKRILFVSMLAGVNLASLRKALASVGADIRIIRIMPNTPMTIGQGICLYTPEEGVSSQDCKLLESLLSSSSVCEKVPESSMDTLGVLTACGPAFMYIIMEALADGAVKQGVPRAQALKFAAQLLVGSGQMVLQTGKHPGLLKDEVCSPGGSTICGVSALENGQLRATLINAIEAATIKTKGMHK